MKISRDEFLAEVRTSAPLLKLWARESIKLISKMVKAEIGAARFNGFFKIEPSFRLKSEKSALAKFDRWDSLESAKEMHDLVGARFVVLLRTDLQIIEHVIKSFSGWSTTIARHFENEVDDDPEVFDYQSIHLLIKGSRGSTINGYVLSDDVTCEIQIRTMMQHAYAELCHDKIYKNFRAIPASAKRLVARSMALMETTDSIFCETAKQLDEVAADRQRWDEYLSERYSYAIQRKFPPGDFIGLSIIERFKHLLESVTLSEVGEIVELPIIRSRISARLHDKLFQSPGCVLTYWLVKNHYIETINSWPDESLIPGLQLVCADLNISYE
ncbi:MULTISPECIES: GTP pyrophosphokinase [unclassified Delftia]|uniref:GTP pyrophosphokinase n=1 Tax=unclassified Delftia TaxID=2613839 RepID=UPI0019010343|nr:MULTISPECIES: RelA/SpoT domain-containing protein [unclassified Delftia]MBK0115898.1 RelA/SpoT domain-containing protein [Delftia sp. S65]MBK0121795.1 RelA/SpoT domain-containing protein [Delftia sp. S67]MBK0133368.1 RelA/SpoT domain-containing protein [Delftia sp. S66]